MGCPSKKNEESQRNLSKRKARVGLGLKDFEMSNFQANLWK
jgi:hypothetical protein